MIPFKGLHPCQDSFAVVSETSNRVQEMEPSWIKTAALILLTILCYEAAFRRPLRDSLGLPGDTRRRHQKGPARYQQRECPAPAEPVSVACPVQQCPACTACPACPAVAPPTPTSPKPTVAQPSACIDYELDDRDNNAFWPWLKDYEHGPGVHKYEQYIDSYNRHFSKFRKQDKIYMAEVGVQSGGSIELWRNYFGAEKLV